MLKMACDLAGHRPSKSPSLTPATNIRHSARLRATHIPSGSAELRIRMDSPKVPISTQAPLSHRLAIRHVGSSTDLPPITSPMRLSGCKTYFEASMKFQALSIYCSKLLPVRNQWLMLTV
jgi:hypothetical protein